MRAPLDKWFSFVVLHSKIKNYCEVGTFISLYGLREINIEGLILFNPITAKILRCFWFAFCSEMLNGVW